jgi:hypothetical protein
MNWESFSGVLPVVLWVLFLLLKKRKQKQPQPGVGRPRRVKRSARRAPDPQEFKRDYEPIEPS